MDVSRPRDRARPVHARGIAMTGPGGAMEVTRYSIEGARESVVMAPYALGEWVRAADHDRIVAEAEARGWNAAVEAALRLLPLEEARKVYKLLLPEPGKPEVEG